jgi:hypothetical protein
VGIGFFSLSGDSQILLDFSLPIDNNSWIISGVNDELSKVSDLTLDI